MHSQTPPSTRRSSIALALGTALALATPLYAQQASTNAPSYTFGHAIAAVLAISVVVASIMGSRRTHQD